MGMGVLFSIFVCIIVSLHGQAVANESSVGLDEILLYQVVIETQEDASQHLAQLNARAIQASVDENLILCKETVDYNHSLKLLDRFQRMGWAAEINKRFVDLDELKTVDPQTAESLTTCVMEGTLTPGSAMDPQTALNRFDETLNRVGAKRSEILSVIEPYVAVFSEAQSDQTAQFLAGMYHYISGQELLSQYDLSLDTLKASPVDLPVFKHYYQARRLLSRAANLPGPLVERACFESAMTTFGLREQGDRASRLIQAVNDFYRYLDKFPNGAHARRASLHRIELLRELIVQESLSPNLAVAYRQEVKNAAESLYTNSPFSADPSVYEEVLVVLTYAEVLSTLQQYDKVIELYQTHYGELDQNDFPAGTYWMFSIFWHVVLTAAEKQNDFETALQFAEMKLADAPGEGNAWPVGGPVAGKTRVLKKAIEFTESLGQTQKAGLFQTQLDQLTSQKKG